MATRRTKQQWLELLEQQKQSGLSVAAFCRDQDISAKCFYYHVRRQRLLMVDSVPSGFVRAECSATQANASQERLSLQIGRCQLHLPADISVPWLAKLVTALS